MKKSMIFLLVSGLLFTLCGSLQADSDNISVNLWSIGKTDAWTDTMAETLWLTSDQAAGAGEWNTTGWQNVEIPSPWNTSYGPVTVSGSNGSSATLTIENQRNCGPYYWTSTRDDSDAVDVGNATLLDAHCNGTEDPGDGSRIVDITVSDISFEYYDLIVYLGGNQGQFYDGTGKIIFNGFEQDFTLIQGEPDGTLTEIVDGTTPGNFIVYRGASDSSFSLQVRGNGFNHLGPTGLQIIESAPNPPAKANAPAPADGSLHIVANPVLSWTDGLFSDYSKVYFGTDPTPDSGEFQIDKTDTTFDPGTLAAGTYYWRIDSVNAAGTTTGDVWSFTVGPPAKAHHPVPVDDSTGIGADSDLSWIAGDGTESYDIYFGTDPTPDSTEFARNQAGTTYDPGRMEPGVTYYWRIDSVNSLGKTTGDVWSLTVMPTPAAGRNTFLVRMPLEGASWKELAYLAAVPASAAVNDNTPSVIALDETGTIPDKIDEYLTLYNPANIYTVDTTVSLDDTACYLAQTFWATSENIVLCDENDYAGALAASALAGRLEVPLMFFDGSAGLSVAALNVIGNDLQCSDALIVNGNSTVNNQLSGIGVGRILLAGDKEIITWMKNNGYPVEYLAVTNANDRGMTDYAPKGSLAAPLLAAGRNGAVAALDYDTEWNVPFNRSSTTTEKPAGLPSNTEPPRKYHDSSDLDYDLGTCTINGQTYDWVVVRMTDGYRLDAAFIDFNGDGDFGDSGEYCPRTSELTINGKRYTFGVNSTQPHPYAYGEIRFSYPSDDELKEELQTYHDQIGHHPEYIAIVGMPQSVPCAHALSYDRGWCDYVMNDNYFADVDEDPLYEIATGRIVGEDVRFVTLNAARGLTYNDLQYRPACDRAFHQCTEEFAGRLYYTPRQLENNGFNVDEWLFLEDEDYSQYGIFIQNEHGWPYGIAREKFLENSPWTVCIVTGTGCNMASLDKYVPPNTWDETNAVELAREGAVCFRAWCRGTGAGKTISRESFYRALLYDGATTGQAHLHGLNIQAADSEYSIRSYDLNACIMYGDPALKLHVPEAPAHESAHITANGKTLTVHAPEKYWVDYIYTVGEYRYTGPGLVGSSYEPAWTYFATYKTGLEITDMTQEGYVPYPLGWMTLREGRDYVIDEHWDGTRTIYWRVRFDQFNESTGLFAQKIDKVDYNVDFVTSDIPGDLDMNGKVDFADFAGFAAHWLDIDCDLGNSFCEGADINLLDGVSQDDLNIVINNWLNSVSP